MHDSGTPLPTTGTLGARHAGRITAAKLRRRDYDDPLRDDCNQRPLLHSPLQRAIFLRIATVVTIFREPRPTSLSRPIIAGTAYRTPHDVQGPPGPSPAAHLSPARDEYLARRQGPRRRPGAAARAEDRRRQQWRASARHPLEVSPSRGDPLSRAEAHPSGRAGPASVWSRAGKPAPPCDRLSRRSSAHRATRYRNRAPSS